MAMLSRLCAWMNYLGGGKARVGPGRHAADHVAHRVISCALEERSRNGSAIAAAADHGHRPVPRHLAQTVLQQPAVAVGDRRPCRAMTGGLVTDHVGDDGEAGKEAAGGGSRLLVWQSLFMASDPRRVGL